MNEKLAAGLDKMFDPQSPKEPGPPPRRYPFEWAIGMLKHGLPVRRASWPPGLFVSDLRRCEIRLPVPAISRDELFRRTYIGGVRASNNPEIVRVDIKTLRGFVVSSYDSTDLVPYAPTYDDMIAEDWDQVYGL